MFDTNNPETYIAIEIRSNIDRYKIKDVVNALWNSGNNNYQLIKSDNFYGLIYDKSYSNFVNELLKEYYKQ